MDANLSAPSAPISLLEGHETTEETIFWVRCHDRTFQHITVVRDDGEKLFYVEGDGALTSASLRRDVKDANGNLAFSLRRYQFDGWFVKDAANTKIAELKHQKYFTRAHCAINLNIFGCDMQVEMRPRDHVATTAYVNADGAIMAEIGLHINNTPRRFNGDRDLSVFRVRAAKGVDLGVVVVMALARVEMAHVWRK
ncbi:hypothetical protein WHR41_07162 [Cladosporium halotolerans]|uniref:Uncharacterized protein n=1 Tax=Cladosporium halotolerans TaxID=1052096 RepID=A0AB34KIN3_9PEZI